MGVVVRVGEKEGAAKSDLRHLREVQKMPADPNTTKAQPLNIGYGTPCEVQAIRNTESILERATAIDAAAWASPMPARMQLRRNRSYAQAVKEFKDDAI